MIKKIISFITISIFMFSLTACSDNLNSREENVQIPSSSVQSDEDAHVNSDEAQTSDSSQESASQAHENEPDETGAEELIVYFSHSGNTESVAKEIQNQTGADIFEIVPETPYTDDYNTLLDVAQDEKSSDARPSISGTIENLENYDVIYLGYPNWWADMPMIVYTFLDTYDLSGKTIAPFVTSGGSGFSNTIDTIKSMEPDAIVTDGLSVRDSDAGNSADAVTDWLSELG